MATDELISLGVGTITVVGAGVALWLARRLRRGRGGGPCTPIAGLTPGSSARIEGTVVLDEAVVSPFMRSRCAYWRLQVSYQERSTSAEGLVWYQSIAREARRDFRLRDASGTVRVAGTSAGFELLPIVHRGPDLPEHAAEFLASQGVPLTDERGRARIFGFEEWALTEGSRVRVSGPIVAGPDGPVVGASGAPARVHEDASFG